MDGSPTPGVSAIANLKGPGHKQAAFANFIVQGLALGHLLCITHCRASLMGGSRMDGCLYSYSCISLVEVLRGA